MFMPTLSLLVLFMIKDFIFPDHVQVQSSVTALAWWVFGQPVKVGPAWGRRTKRDWSQKRESKKFVIGSRNNAGLVPSAESRPPNCRKNKTAEWCHYIILRLSWVRAPMSAISFFTIWRSGICTRNQPEQDMEAILSIVTYIIYK